MKLLLDTHMLLWAAGQPNRLSPVAHALLDDNDNHPLFSAASLWEIAIKHGLTAGWGGELPVKGKADCAIRTNRNAIRRRGRALGTTSGALRVHTVAAC